METGVEIIDPRIFNTKKTDYGNNSLFLGEQEVGVFDTIHRTHPKIWANYKQQKSQDWSEDEFGMAVCNAQFKSAPRSNVDTMLITLMYQWEQDSVAARAIAPILAPFITNSELWAAWLKITEIEVLHGATYSEIIRLSFDNPSEILGDVLKHTQTFERMETVARVFANTYEASHKYALRMIPNNQETYNHVFLFVVALYLMERIQFMASFAVTFANCELGLFQPIGKAVQKIAADELEVHCALDRYVLEHEMKTERGRVAYEQNKDTIQAMFNEVIASEKAFIDYLFSEGRELPGVDANNTFQWVLYNARECANVLGIESEYKFPSRNPLRFMDKWLNINLTQPAPQEQAVAEYRLNAMTQDHDDVEFEADF